MKEGSKSTTVQSKKVIILIFQTTQLLETHKKHEHSISELCSSSVKLCPESEESLLTGTQIISTI